MDLAFERLRPDVQVGGVWLRLGGDQFQEDSVPRHETPTRSVHERVASVRRNQ